MKPLSFILLPPLIICALAACNTSTSFRSTATPESQYLQTVTPGPQATSPLTMLSPRQIDPEDCIDQTCTLDGHFLLQNPIPPGANQAVDVTYRFGDTQEGTREIHHGVEIGNPIGTPVLAAADGKVIFAGDDALVLLGLNPNFYGKVIMIEHHLPGIAQNVFTVYAHLSQISVENTETVVAGQPIGNVGKSGAALGSHLHFEVRLGQNNYPAAVNPELWLTLSPNPELPTTGALAGFIYNAKGNPLRVTNIRLEYSPVEEGHIEKYFKLSTYYDGSVTTDPAFNENYMISGLVPGWYRITLIAAGQYFSRWIQIVAGKLSYLAIPLQ